ncbi:YuiA family protein [Brevibacillus sp. SYSU BS000544]|uniref:YuiA family protein n=1 Tax=Brevibacillus sp. SYSU BS000544 TaxID=3416443 RepID=UPI003CE4760A
MSRRHNQSETCPYCKGQGYFQLIVGGTEDCPNCDGAGTPSQESIQPIVAASKK